MRGFIACEFSKEVVNFTRLDIFREPSNEESSNIVVRILRIKRRGGWMVGVMVLRNRKWLDHHRRQRVKCGARWRRRDWWWWSLIIRVLIAVHGEHYGDQSVRRILPYFVLRAARPAITSLIWIPWFYRSFNSISFNISHFSS